MRAVDTNVLARFVLADDPGQHATARHILNGPVWVASTVWLELGWLLGKKLKLERAVVAEMLDALLSMQTISTSDDEGLRWAISRFRAGADWADAMHLVMAEGVATTFATFDQGIADTLEGETTIVIETLV